jgi:RNA polymerase sigma factor (TIGR02999 family)
MSQVTEILRALDRGEFHASEDLLPLVYAELRQLAAQKLSREKPGQTLQATALVHEAWLRLARGEQEKSEPRWDGRRYFFGAAAEAMRRILIENARRKARVRHGGDCDRVNLNEVEIASPLPTSELLALNEALDQLAGLDAPAAELVKLRFFAGLTQQQAAELLGISRSSADRIWLFARAWLYEQVRPEKS